MRRLATEHITKEQLEEIEENIYLASFHASKGHMEQMAELDNRFHHILYEACDSKMLQNLLQDFHQYVIRIRKKHFLQWKEGWHQMRNTVESWKQLRQEMRMKQNSLPLCI